MSKPNSFSHFSSLDIFSIKEPQLVSLHPQRSNTHSTFFNNTSNNNNAPLLAFISAHPITRVIKLASTSETHKSQCGIPFINTAVGLRSPECLH